MNGKMRKFYKELKKINRGKAKFKIFNGKIVYSDDLEELKIPSGYVLKDNAIFMKGLFNNKKIGEFDVYSNDDEEISIDDFAFSELSDEDDKDLEDENKTRKNDKKNKKSKSSSKKKDDELELTEDLEEDDHNVYRVYNVSSDDELELSEDLEEDENVNNETTTTKIKGRSFIKRAFHAIAYTVGKFFENFGKRNILEISEDLMDEENDANYDLNRRQNQERENSEGGNEEPTVIEENVIKSEKNSQNEERKKEIISNKLQEIADYIVESDKYIKANDLSSFEGKLDYINTKFDELYNRFLDGELLKSNDICSLYTDIVTLRKDMLDYVNNNQTNTYQSTAVEPSTSQSSTVEPSTTQTSTVEPSTTQSSTVEPSRSQTNTYQTGYSQPSTSQPSTYQSTSVQSSTVEPSTTQTSTGYNQYSYNDTPQNPIIDIIDLTKETFSSIDNYDKVEIPEVFGENKKVSIDEVGDRIKYYDEFLKTHDLSHPDDQAMKQRMESKLELLKDIYNSEMKDKNDKIYQNDLRTQRMAFYTQRSMDIDKEIENNEIERQNRLLRFKQDPSAIQLDADETRSFYERKEALEALKAECLMRKEEINKYYQEETDKLQAAWSYYKTR